MPYESCAVANFFLDYAAEHGVAVSNLTLLKILYFAHGWHLVERDIPLLLEEFQAWKFGPVIPVVYRKFRIYGSDPITGRADTIDAATGEVVRVDYKFDKSLKDFLKGIFDTYAPIGPFALSDLTHVSGSPWEVLWNRESLRANVGMRVSNDLIKKHFLEAIRQRRV